MTDRSVIQLGLVSMTTLPAPAGTVAYESRGSGHLPHTTSPPAPTEEQQ